MPSTRRSFAPLHRQLAEVEKERQQSSNNRSRRRWSPRRANLDPAYHAQARRVRPDGEIKWDGTRRRSCRRCPPERPRNRLGFAQWLVSPESSADGPRGGQPLLAAGLRHRPRQDRRGLRLAGRAAEPPGTARLAGGAVRGRRLGREDGHEATGAVGHLSAVVARSRRTGWRRTRPIGCCRAARASGSTPRCCAIRRLFVSGLLVEKIGGPSVKPPQPAGLWEAVGYVDSNTAHFTADTGLEKVHRRSLYTFWKRTAPPPQMNAFDAPSREACTVRRERTNTPLQALLLLNETQYVEALAALAERTCVRAAAQLRNGWLPVPAGDGAEAGCKRAGRTCEPLSGESGHLHWRRGISQEANRGRRDEARHEV